LDAANPAWVRRRLTAGSQRGDALSTKEASVVLRLYRGIAIRDADRFPRGFGPCPTGI
jgi:hypothetical protein